MYAAVTGTGKNKSVYITALYNFYATSEVDEASLHKA